MHTAQASNAGHKADGIKQGRTGLHTSSVEGPLFISMVPKPSTEPDAMVGAQETFAKLFNLFIN